MLRMRLIVGTLLILGLIAIAWLDASSPIIRLGQGRIGPGLVLIAVCIFAFAPILAWEFNRLTSAKSSRSGFWLNYLAISLGIASVGILPDLLPEHLVMPAVLTCPFLILFVCAIIHARTRQIDGFVQSVGAVFLGYAAIGVPLGFWILLRHDRDAWTLAGAILCVKSADIGAYFTGISIGRHRLIPWLSPGKTWEGLAGGIIFSGCIGAALATLSASALAMNALVDPIAIAYGALVAVVLGVTGTLGDLLESLLKRGAGVKDSGSILPGMGGLYDVFDSLLLAGPVAWWMLAN